MTQLYVWFLTLACCCFSFVFPSIGLSQEANQMSQEVTDVSKDANALNWFRGSRANETDLMTIRDVEERFFRYWPEERLHELQFSDDNTLALPVAWRLVQRNIFTLNPSEKGELGYFFGFLLGKCNAAVAEEFRHNFVDNLYVDQMERLRINENQDYLQNLEFELSINEANIVGRYPQMSEMPGSEPGFIQRTEQGIPIWKSDIPKTKMPGIMWGSWDLTPRMANPRMATVFASSQSVYCLTVFYRGGVYLHAFDLETGHLTDVCFFDFVYRRGEEKGAGEENGSGTETGK